MDRVKRSARVVAIIKLFQRAHQNSSVPMTEAYMDAMASSLSSAINAILDDERAAAFADAERIFQESMDVMFGRPCG